MQTGEALGMKCDLFHNNICKVALLHLLTPHESHSKDECKLVLTLCTLLNNQKHCMFVHVAKQTHSIIMLLIYRFIIPYNSTENFF